VRGGGKRERERERERSKLYALLYKNVQEILVAKSKL
jgi:hypothetical protein